MVVVHAAAVAAALATLAQTSSGAATGPLQLLDLDSHPSARCMDGSPGGFYVRRAQTTRGATTWVLDFEGGGECTTEANCSPRNYTQLGSSSYFPLNVTFDRHFSAADPTANPDFYDANLVRLKYCSGDLWSGNRTSAESQTKFWFSGHRIVVAVLDELTADLAAATAIIVTGESAGGAAVLTNLDYIAARFPNAATAGAAIAGFNNWAFPFTGPNKTSRGPGNPSWVDFREPAWEAIVELWDPVMNADCQRYYAYAPTCMVECYKYKFIRTPLFVFESQADSVNLMGHNSLPGLHISTDPSAPPPPPIPVDIMTYLAGWHRNMSTCLAEITDQAPGIPSLHGVVGMHASGRHSVPGNPDPSTGNATLGVFNPSCYIHTEFTNEIRIGGVNYKAAFRNFFFGTAERAAPTAGPGGPGAQTILFDECGELCNPTCNAAPPSKRYRCVGQSGQCIAEEHGPFSDPMCEGSCGPSPPPPPPPAPPAPLPSADRCNPKHKHVPGQRAGCSVCAGCCKDDLGASFCVSSLVFSCHHHHCFAPSSRLGPVPHCADESGAFGWTLDRSRCCKMRCLCQEHLPSTSTSTSAVSQN